MGEHTLRQFGVVSPELQSHFQRPRGVPHRWLNTHYIALENDSWQPAHCHCGALTLFDPAPLALEDFRRYFNNTIIATDIKHRKTGVHLFTDVPTASVDKAVFKRMHFYRHLRRLTRLQPRNLIRCQPHITQLRNHCIGGSAITR